jgi:hypothetical protein
VANGASEQRDLNISSGFFFRLPLASVLASDSGRATAVSNAARRLDTKSG